MSREKHTVRSLLDISVGEPETREVEVPRLGLRITLQSLSYDRLTALRGTEDADMSYFLASAVEPDFRDRRWYREHMGCPTPVEAVKKLLRPGEVRAILRECDTLNGYGPGAVLSVERDDQALRDDALGAALEDLEKN